MAYEYYEFRDRELNLPAEIARIKADLDAEQDKGIQPNALAAIHMHLASLRTKLADQQRGIHRVGSVSHVDATREARSICVCGLMLPKSAVDAMTPEEYQAHPGHHRVNDRPAMPS